MNDSLHVVMPFASLRVATGASLSFPFVAFFGASLTCRSDAGAARGIVIRGVSKFAAIAIMTVAVLEQSAYPSGSGWGRVGKLLVDRCDVAVWLDWSWHGNPYRGRFGPLRHGWGGCSLVGVPVECGGL